MLKKVSDNKGERIMEKAVEFHIEKEDFKRYLEECLTEENIDYQIRIEDRWIQQYKEASKYYQVYCLYVNNNNLDKVRQFVKQFNNATIITDDIEELKNVEEEEIDNKSTIFTLKNFLNYYWCAIIIIAILIVIGIKFKF